MNYILLLILFKNFLLTYVSSQCSPDEYVFVVDLLECDTFDKCDTNGVAIDMPDVNLAEYELIPKRNVFSGNPIDLLSFFQLGVQNGQLRISMKKEFDRERGNLNSNDDINIVEFDLSCKPKSDMNNKEFRFQLQVNIIDVNDNSPMFTNQNNSAEILENRDINTIVIQNLIATDPDFLENGQVNYELSSVDSQKGTFMDGTQYFSLSPNGNNLIVSSNLDYEALNLEGMNDITFEMVLTAKDQASNKGEVRSGSTTLKLKLLDDDDLGPIFETDSCGTGRYKTICANPIFNVNPSIWMSDAPMNLQYSNGENIIRARDNDTLNASIFYQIPDSQPNNLRDYFQINYANNEARLRLNEKIPESLINSNDLLSLTIVATENTTLERYSTAKIFLIKNQSNPIFFDDSWLLEKTLINGYIFEDAKTGEFIYDKDTNAPIQLRGKYKSFGGYVASGLIRFSDQTLPAGISITDDGLLFYDGGIPLDFESDNKFIAPFIVQSSNPDNSNSQIANIQQIEIRNVNDEPPIIQKPAPISVGKIVESTSLTRIVATDKENDIINFRIMRVVATDMKTGEVREITNVDNQFSIDSNGVISGKQLNEGNIYSLLISASDGVHQTYETVQIGVDVDNVSTDNSFIISQIIPITSSQLQSASTNSPLLIYSLDDVVKLNGNSIQHTAQFSSDNNNNNIPFHLSSSGDLRLIAPITLNNAPYKIPTIDIRDANGIIGKIDLAINPVKDNLMSPQFQTELINGAKLNYKIGQTLPKIGATDLETSNRITYKLISDAYGNEMFGIDARTGQLFAKKTEDITAPVTLTIEASDNDNSPIARKSYFNLVLIPPQAQDFFDQNILIERNFDENIPPNTLIHQYQVPSNAICSITDVNMRQYFLVNHVNSNGINKCEVRTLSPLDFESNPQFFIPISLEGTDNNRYIRLLLNDVDEYPPNFLFPSNFQNVYLRENMVSDSVPLSIFTSAKDNDGTSQIKYFTNSSLIRIDENNGLIYFTNNAMNRQWLDASTQPQDVEIFAYDKPNGVVGKTLIRLHPFHFTSTQSTGQCSELINDSINFLNTPIERTLQNSPSSTININIAEDINPTRYLNKSSKILKGISNDQKKMNINDVNQYFTMIHPNQLLIRNDNLIREKFQLSSNEWSNINLLLSVSVYDSVRRKCIFGTTIVTVKFPPQFKLIDCNTNMVNKKFIIDEDNHLPHKVGSVGIRSNNDNRLRYRRANFGNTITPSLFDINELTGDIVQIAYPSNSIGVYRFPVRIIDLAYQCEGKCEQMIDSEITINRNLFSPIFPKSFNEIELNSESSIIPRKLSSLPATDNDQNGHRFSSVKYTISQIYPSTYANYFRIDESLGDLFLTQNLPDDSTDNIFLTIEATDSAKVNPKSSKTIVNIKKKNNVLNDTPTFQTILDKKIVNENSLVNSIIYQAKLLRPNLNNILFEIESGNEDDKFSIDPTSGNVFLRKPLDYEEKTFYDLIIKAREQSSRLYSFMTLRIEVNDVNEFPPKFDRSNYFFQVRPSLTSSVYISQLKATDDDKNPNEKLSYRLTNTNKFTIDDNGILSILPHQTSVQEQFEFLVYASDRFGRESLPSKIIVQTIPIVEEKIFNSDRCPHKDAVLLPENKVQQPLVNLVIFLAQDSNEIRQKIRLKNYLTEFQIDPNSLLLSNRRPFDYETISSPQIPLQIFHLDFPNDICQITVTIVNENDEAPIFLDDNMVIPFQVDDTSSQFYARAKDPDADILQYKIEEIPDELRNLININPISGLIFTTDPNRLTELAPTLSQIPFKISVSDGKHKTTTMVRWTINFDGNYEIRSNTPTHHQFYQESQQTPLLFKMDGQVVDRRNGIPLPQNLYRIQYSLINTTYVSIDKSTGEISIHNWPLTDTVINCIVRMDVEKLFATSPTVPSKNIPITIRLIPEKKTKPILEKYYSSFYVKEDDWEFYQQEQNSYRMPIPNSAIRVISPGNHRYEIISSAPFSSYFKIDPQTGIISQTRSIFNVTRIPNRFNLKVVGIDQANMASEPATIEIFVERNNYSPQFNVDKQYLTSVSPNIQIGTTVLKILAQDRDIPNTRYSKLQFDLIPIFNHQNPFDIDKDSGVIFTKSRLDTQYQQYEFIVRTQDSAFFPKGITVGLKIFLEGNQYPPRFLNNTFGTLKIFRSTSLQEVIYRVTAVDDDVLPPSNIITYSIEPSKYSNYFYINPETGELRLRTALPLNEGRFDLNIRAEDGGGLSSIFNLQVIVDNNDMKRIQFHPNDMNKQIQLMINNDDVCQFVHQVQLAAGTDQTKIRFSIIGNSLSIQHFGIDRLTGIIRIIKQIEVNKQYSLIVQIVHIDNPTTNIQKNVYRITGTRLIGRSIEIEEKSNVCSLETLKVEELNTRLERPLFLNDLSFWEKESEMIYELENNKFSKNFAIDKLNGNLFLISDNFIYNKHELSIRMLKEDKLERSCQLNIIIPIQSMISLQWDPREPDEISIMENFDITKLVHQFMSNSQSNVKFVMENDRLKSLFFHLETYTGKLWLKRPLTNLPKSIKQLQLIITIINLKGMQIKKRRYFTFKIIRSSSYQTNRLPGIIDIFFNYTSFGLLDDFSKYFHNRCQIDGDFLQFFEIRSNCQLWMKNELINDNYDFPSTLPLLLYSSNMSMLITIHFDNQFTPKFNMVIPNPTFVEELSLSNKLQQKTYRMRYVVDPNEIQVDDELLRLDIIDKDFGENGKIYCSFQNGGMNPYYYLDGVSLKLSMSLWCQSTRIKSDYIELNIICRDSGSPSRVTKSILIGIYAGQNMFSPEWSSAMKNDYYVDLNNNFNREQSLLIAHASDKLFDVNHDLNRNNRETILNKYFHSTNITYGIEENEMFEIDSKSGELFLINRSLEVIKFPMHNLELIAMDNGIPKRRIKLPIILHFGTKLLSGRWIYRPGFDTLLPTTNETDIIRIGNNLKKNIYIDRVKIYDSFDSLKHVKYKWSNTDNGIDDLLDLNEENGIILWKGKKLSSDLQSINNRLLHLNITREYFPDEILKFPVKFQFPPYRQIELERIKLFQYPELILNSPLNSIKKSIKEQLFIPINSWETIYSIPIHHNIYQFPLFQLIPNQFNEYLHFQLDSTKFKIENDTGMVNLRESIDSSIFYNETVIFSQDVFLENSRKSINLSIVYNPIIKFPTKPKLNYEELSEKCRDNRCPIGIVHLTDTVFHECTVEISTKNYELENKIKFHTEFKRKCLISIQLLDDEDQLTVKDIDIQIKFFNFETRNSKIINWKIEMENISPNRLGRISLSDTESDETDDDGNEETILRKKELWSNKISELAIANYLDNSTLNFGIDEKLIEENRVKRISTPSMELLSGLQKCHNREQFEKDILFYENFKISSISSIRRMNDNEQFYNLSKIFYFMIDNDDKNENDILKLMERMNISTYSIHVDSIWRSERENRWEIWCCLYDEQERQLTNIDDIIESSLKQIDNELSQVNIKRIEQSQIGNRMSYLEQQRITSSPPTLGLKVKPKHIPFYEKGWTNPSWVALISFAVLILIASIIAIVLLFIFWRRYKRQLKDYSTPPSSLPPTIKRPEYETQSLEMYVPQEDVDLGELEVAFDTKDGIKAIRQMPIDSQQRF
ncbi:hypothetical protein SNEBB_002098 [Seison nebaliae]|nr:hypothetical protein SNEBB_002098 [Seison nebaliae]